MAIGCFGSLNFTRKQWLVTVTFIVVNFCNAMVVSMQAPFYPHEAEKKGCIPSEYGLVFGIFELTVFIVSPIIGANLNRMGVKATLNIGIGTVGVTSIMFGCLDKIENGKVFLGLSFALRIIEACGNSGFLTGSFSMIAKEFPDNVATMFAILETFFGLGMIFGPTVGGALYEIGGFFLPFVTLGSVLVLAAIFTSFILPNSGGNDDQMEKPSMMRALKVPSILMACYSVACAAASMGFIQATLEPHMRNFNLSPLQLGSMFIVQGACYGITAPMFGAICDRKPPKVIALVGSVVMICAFALMGPLPFFPFQKSVGLIIGSLVLQGVGLGAEVVSGFADAHRSAIRAGFPDTIDTYGLISGLWTSVFALGAFIGPTLAGILFDAAGFPMATLFIIVSQALVFILMLSFIVYGCMSRPSQETPVTDKDEEEEGVQDIDDDENTGLLDQSSSTYGTATDRRRERARRRGQRRQRKYSEVVSGSVSGSMARSMSMAYPQFLMPGVASSYRAPPNSMSASAVLGHHANSQSGLSLALGGSVVPPAAIEE